MKKVISVMVAMLMAATMSLNAAQRGKFIHLDNTVNKDLKPRLAFCQDHQDGEDITTLLLWTVKQNTYHEFTDAARILIRFSDNSMVRLARTKTSEDKKEKFTKKNGTATIAYCKTITSYEVTPEVIEKLEAGLTIVKVRIVFMENEAKDYDIAEGYQARLAADLLKSYQEASGKNRKANADLSDEDF